MNNGKGRKGFDQGRRLLAVLVCLAAVILAGCIPNKFTDEEKTAALGAAKAVMNAYLARNLDGAEITKVDMICVTDSQPGYLLSDYAEGTFSYHGGSYNFVVNIKNGQVYTSLFLNMVRDELTERIMDGLEIQAADVDMADCVIYYAAPDKDKKLSPRRFKNVFPAFDVTEKIVQNILKPDSPYTVRASIQYKGEAVPEAAQSLAAPYDSLKSVTIYRVFDDRELMRRESGYMFMLPALSAEQLTLKYDEQRSSYKQNNIATIGVFRLVYGEYIREVDRENVKEVEIAPDDIVLAVADDYIELSCGRELYEFYISTADAGVRDKYLYMRLPGYRPKKPSEYREGMWRELQGDFFYNVEKIMNRPHLFTKSNSAEHSYGTKIYTKAAVEKLVKN